MSLKFTTSFYGTKIYYVFLWHKNLLRLFMAQKFTTSFHGTVIYYVFLWNKNFPPIVKIHVRNCVLMFYLYVNIYVAYFLKSNYPDLLHVRMSPCPN